MWSLHGEIVESFALHGKKKRGLGTEGWSPGDHSCGGELSGEGAGISYTY
jgi:hypothetical protein